MKSNLPEVEKRIVVKDSRTDNIQNYDEDNLYPQRIRDYIRSSGTAQSCVNLYGKFVRGKGLADSNFYKTKINSKGLTVDQLHRKLTQDKAKHAGFAFHVNYNLLGEIVNLNYVNFEFCRFATDSMPEYSGRIAVYDDWERIKRRSIEKDLIKWYNFYNPETVLDEIEQAGGIDNYQGQIFYFSPLYGEYPLAPCDSVLEDVITDAGIKDFRLRQVTTSFIGSHIVEYPYEFQSDKERDEEKENWSNFQGTSNANKIILVENPDAEKSGIKIHALDIQNNDKLFEITNRTCKDSIIESFGQPPQLLGVSVAGKLGTADEIRDAYDFYNSYTEDDRIQMEEVYKDVFSRWSYNINPSGNYTIIPLSFGTTNNNIGL